jgi:sugar phosphate isomerase/epimerase
MNDLTRRQLLAGAGAAVSAAALSASASAQSSATATAGVGAAGVPRFRLGIVTYNIAANWDIPTMLRVCRAVGLGPVELRTTHRHGVEPTLSADARRDVKKQFADAGVEIWGCGSVCEFHSPDQAVVRQNIETCKRFCDLVKDIGGKGVKVRPNSLPANVPVEKTLEQIGRSLAECGRAAADAGVEIWVEVHGPGTSHPPHCKTMMEVANHTSVGLTWNSNPTDVKDGSVAEYFRLVRPWIKSVHINELTSGYPYRELFRLLRETGYDRVTLAEIQGVRDLEKNTPDVASGERFMRYYKALWQELCR